MKTAKRALSVFLALMMTLGLLPAAAAAGDLRAGRSSLSFTPAEGLTLTVGNYISKADGIVVGTVSGGTGPYVFFESDDENGFGTIGLLLDDTGALYGTPTEVGTFTFGITVEDYGNQYDYGNQHDSVSGFVTITVSDGAPPVGTTYTVTWDPDGGTFADSTTVPAEVTVEAGNSTTVPEVTRDGCAFLGWSSDGGGTYLTGDTVTPTADVTYTAQWAVLRLVEISPTDQITLTYPDQTVFTYTIDSADYDTALGYGIVTSTDDTIFTVSDTAGNTTYTLEPLSVGAAYLTIVFPADDANHYHRTTISIEVEVAAGAALTAPRLELFNAATADEDAMVMITPVDADRDKTGYHFEYEKAAAEPGADPASVTAVAVGDPYTTFTVPAADVGTYWVRAAADNYTPSGWTSIDVTRDYTITIQPGDHAAAGETDKTATVQSSVGTYTLPAADTFAAAEGYAFDGWLAGGEKMDAGASVSVADDMTITARWKADSFAVSLEETSEVTGREIAGPTLSVDYAAADIAATPISFYNLSSTPRQFTLTYDAAKVTIYSDSACTATVNNNSTIARDAGTAWTLYVKPAAGLGAADYSADVTVANDRGMSATATYQFTVSTIERSIVWNDSFPADAAETIPHSGGDASVRSGAAGSTITLPTAPAATGYVFLGWFDAADGGDEINADYTVPALNEALNLYAHWAKNYALNKKLTADGDAIKVADHYEGETFTLPAAETRNGYTFDKWNDGTTDYDAGASYTMPAADVTITAKWKTNEITYTYADVTDAKVGTAITPVTPTASGTDADSGTLVFTDESGIGSQLSDFGLALDGTTGEISGAPIRAASAQAFTIGYTARNGYEGTATFTLTAEKGAATLTTTPVIADDWTYDVASHALVKTPGAAENGEVQYSVNGGEYSAAVPQATDAGAYTVKYRVVGAAGCDGIGETELGTVTVGKATLTAGDVSTHSATFDDITYNGQAGALTVTAKTQDFASGMVTSFDAVTYTRASADAGDGVAVDARITAITSDNYRLPEGGLEIGNVGAIRVEPAELTIDVSGVRAAKVYDGDATIETGELTGAATLETGIGGETATVTGASYAFNSADVESASTVTATITGFKVEAGSTDVSANYKLPDPAAATTAAGTGAITAAKLAAPTGTLTASADGADQITVGGAAASEGTLTYVITAPDAATGNVTGAASGVFTGLEPETAYTFAAYAKSEDANHTDSDPTATATATTLPAPTYALVIVTSDTDDTAVETITVEADAYGYSEAKTATIYIRNTGNRNAAVAVSLGDNRSGFTVAPDQLSIAAGAVGSVTVTIPAGLAAGGHTATLTATWDGHPDSADSAAIGFTVEKATLTAADFTAADLCFRDMVYAGHSDTTVPDANVTGAITAVAGVSVDAVTYTRASALAGDGVQVDARITAITSENYQLPAGGLVLGGVGAIRVEPAAVTLDMSGVSVAARTYDGTTDAALSGSPTLIGVLENEVTMGAVTAAFADAEVGTDKTVTVSVALDAGDYSANYSFPSPLTDRSLTGEITGAVMTLQPGGDITGVKIGNAVDLSGHSAASADPAPESGDYSIAYSVAGEDGTVSSSSFTPARTGEITVTATLRLTEAGQKKYTLGESTGTFTVTVGEKPALAGTWSGTGAVYGDTISAALAPASGTVAGYQYQVGEGDWSDSVPTGCSVGDTIRVKAIPADTENYRESEPQTITVTAKEITLMADMLIGMTAAMTEGEASAPLSMADAEIGTGVGSEKLTLKLNAGRTVTYKDPSAVGSENRYDVSASMLTLADRDSAKAANYTLTGTVEMRNGELRAAPTYTITASDAGSFADAAYGYAQPAARTVTFTNTGNQTQNITVTVTDDDSAFTVMAGGEEVTGTTKVRVAPDGAVALTIRPKAGLAAKDSYGVTVKAASENNPEGAGRELTFKVDKAEQAALTFENAATVAFGETLTLRAAGGSGEGAVTCTVADGTGGATISGTTLTPTKIGTVTVTATKAGGVNYNDASATQTITITEGAPTLTITPQGDGALTYSGAEQSLLAAEGAAENGTVRYAVVAKGAAEPDPSAYGESAKATDAGEYDVWYYVKGAGNYGDTAPARIGAKIAPKPLEKPTMETASYRATGAAITPTLIGFDSAVMTKSGDDSRTEPGDYTLRVSLNDPANYCWSDGTTAPAELAWAITAPESDPAPAPAPGPGPAVPSAPAEERETFTVTYAVGENGTTEDAVTETVERGTAPAAVPAVVPNEGYRFLGWSLDGETVVEPGGQIIEADTTFTAVYEETGGTDDDGQGRMPYMSGRGDATFAPNDNLTRGEAVTMLSRLIVGFDMNADYGTPDFTDAQDHWSRNFISFGVAHDLVHGYADGSYRPDASVTRAEFAVMIANYLGVSPSETPAEGAFRDTAEHWAAGYITALREAGCISGYPDGSFRPQQLITRAEAATMVNGALGRLPAAKSDYAENPFTDVDENAWYFGNVMEAAVPRGSAELLPPDRQ